MCSLHAKVSLHDGSLSLQPQFALGQKFCHKLRNALGPLDHGQMPRAVDNLERRALPQLVGHVLPHRGGQHAVAVADQEGAFTTISRHLIAHIVGVQGVDAARKALQRIIAHQRLDVGNGGREAGVGIRGGDEPAAGRGLGEGVPDEGLGGGGMDESFGFADGDAVVPGGGVGGGSEGVGVAGDKGADAGGVGQGGVEDGGAAEGDADKRSSGGT